MGYALAVAAKNLNMEVSLISGPVNLRNPQGVQLVRIETALEMQVAMEAHFESADLLGLHISSPCLDCGSPVKLTLETI